MRRSVTRPPQRCRTSRLRSAISKKLPRSPRKMAMKLAGDLAEFSLADLVQVAGVARRTCAVRVLAADGNGTLYLHGGEVVSGIFEDLSGFDAFVALVAAHAGHFQVENGAQPERPNLQGNVQKLLLEANARIEEGAIPKPQRRTPPPATAAAATGAATARPAPTAGRGLWIGLAAALLLLGGVSWLAFARPDVAVGAANLPPASGAAAAAAGPPAGGATELTGPRGAGPTL